MGEHRPLSESQVHLFAPGDQGETSANEIHTFLGRPETVRCAGPLLIPGSSDYAYASGQSIFRR
jgi:hypothetical protein